MTYLFNHVDISVALISKGERTLTIIFYFTDTILKLILLKNILQAAIYISYL